MATARRRERTRMFRTIVSIIVCECMCMASSHVARYCIVVHIQYNFYLLFTQQLSSPIAIVCVVDSGFQVFMSNNITQLLVQKPKLIRLLTNT